MTTKAVIQPSSEGQVARTSKTIAYTLLALYSLALLLVGIVAALKDDPQVSQVWLDLFKSGFLILGGGLTTIIGYYFGSRGLQEAETRVATAMQELDQAREEIESQKKKISELSEKQAPTYDEDALPMVEPPAGQ